MSSPELPTTDSISCTLKDIVANVGFDNFLHYQDLARHTAETKCTTEQWQRLLQEWGYNPIASIEERGRGNCVDLALYTQYMLSRVGIQACVIGKAPEEYFSPQGERIAFQRHTVTMSGPSGQRQMYEPGRRLAQHISLEPVGIVTDAGRQRYETLAIDDGWLVQKQSFSNGYTGQREFDLSPLTTEEAIEINRRLFRLPRNLEMITRAHEGIPYMRIEYDQPLDTLTTSTIPGLPARFAPEDIPAEINKEISIAFGFDVKEELLAAIGILRALPKDFWVTRRLHSDNKVG